MDFYGTPTNETFRYNFVEWFDLPLPGSNRTEKAIAVSKDASQYFIATYSIVITLAFAALNKIATLTVTTWFNLGEHGNRHIIFVTYFNSSSPPTAAYRMLRYMKRALLKSKRNNRWAVNWDALFSSLFLCSIATTIMIANAATVLLVGGNKLVIRTAARANPAAIFYPAGAAEFRGTQYTQFRSWHEQRSAALFRALGNFKSSTKKLKDFVKIHADRSKSDKGPELTFKYEYSLSGADFGLQRATELQYTVKGRCWTAYEWSTKDPEYPDSDAYLPWGDESMIDYADRRAGNYSGPWANVFSRHADFGEDKKLVEIGAYEFAMIPNTVYRRSIDSNTIDPWYLTGDTISEFEETLHLVKPGRPAVACVQNDTWAYGGRTVKYVVDLYKLPGLKENLSLFIRENVFQREFAVPPIINIASNLGNYALESGRSYNTNTKRFLASISSLAKDLENLVYISYAYSREVVRNTATLNSNFNSLGSANEAAVNGSVPAKSADFILESQEVAALSVKVLLTVPLLCIFLWLLVWLHGKIVKPQRRLNNTGNLARYSLRSIGFSAQSLYFLNDEEICGEMKWSGRVSDAPYIQDIDRDHVPFKGGAEGRTPVAVGRQDGDTHRNTPTVRVSSYTKPKLVPINESETGVNTRDRPSRLTRCLPCARPKRTEKYALVMTNNWRRTGRLGRENGGHVDWAEIRHNLNRAEGRWSPPPEDKDAKGSNQ